MTRAALALLTVLVLSACGVGPQPAPQEIDIPVPSTTRAGPTGAPDGPRVTVWFVRGARLEPAERPATRLGMDAALEALAAGPTRAEVVGGLRTALSPQSLMPDRPAEGQPVVTVEVAREFTDVAGGNQLLATAQVVFTITEFPGIEAVRITAEGVPLEVPTDDGLTAEPVSRADYGSLLAPEPARAPAGGAPSGEPSTAPPAAPSTPGRRRGCVTGP